jgi:hypothetical protein
MQRLQPDEQPLQPDEHLENVNKYLLLLLLLRLRPVKVDLEELHLQL